MLKLLPHDVVDLILERLPVESLLSFKCVSKKWKSTIESRRFQERHFLSRRQSRGPDILCMRLNYVSDDDANDDDVLDARIVFGSSIAYTVRFPISGHMYCHGSCDGLVCLYSLYEPSVVVNPATRFHRSFPLSSYQQLHNDKFHNSIHSGTSFRFEPHELGFGKDKIKGTYKPVWLYNSSEFGLDNVTTCEVFDFSTNDWKYLLPASPYRVRPDQRPVYLDGSLYWFTECEETKVLSLNLHTGTFQVICKAPFAHVHDPYSSIMCVLDNRLCVSQNNWPTQVIWSFDSCKTWKKMCSIDLTKTSSWFGGGTLLPIAILRENKLLLRGPGYCQPLVIHDLRAKSYDLLFKPTKPVGSVYYFQSLFSV